MVLVGQVKARTMSATTKDDSTEVVMTLSQEERSVVSCVLVSAMLFAAIFWDAAAWVAAAVTAYAVTAVAVSLFMTISKQNAYFVYESELYSRFLPSANKIAILFVKSQKESVLCLRVL